MKYDSLFAEEVSLLFAFADQIDILCGSSSARWLLRPRLSCVFKCCWVDWWACSLGSGRLTSDPTQEGLAVVECSASWGLVKSQWPALSVQPMRCRTQWTCMYRHLRAPNTLSLTSFHLSCTRQQKCWLLPSLTTSGLPHDCSYVLSAIISVLYHILHVGEAVKPTPASYGPLVFVCSERCFEVQ